MAHDDDVKKPETASSDEPNSSKREFLSKSGALLAVLGAISTGTFTTAWSQSKPAAKPAAPTAALPNVGERTRVLPTNEAAQLKLVMAEAMRTQNMEAALKNNGRGLSPEVERALRSLNGEDLRVASMLEQKLASGLRNKLEGDNNGIIGM